MSRAALARGNLGYEIGTGEVGLASAGARAQMPQFIPSGFHQLNEQQREHHLHSTYLSSSFQSRRSP
jgi:hypothetical protein